MMNAIRASFYKMFHDKSFGLSLIFTALWGLTIGGVRYLTMGTRGISDVSQTSPFWGAYLGGHPIVLPLIVCIVLFFTGEYKDHSWKLLIAKGVSKVSYYVSRVISVITLSFIISAVAVLSGMICDLTAYGGSFSAGYLFDCVKFALGQGYANSVVAILVLSVSMIIKSGEIAAFISSCMLVFGYYFLNKLQIAMNLGEILTDVWAFDLSAFAEFGEPGNWGWISLMLLLYLVVFGGITIFVLGHRDVE